MTVQHRLGFTSRPAPASVPRVRRPTAPLKDVTSREELLAEAASPEAVAGREAFLAPPRRLRRRGGLPSGRPRRSQRRSSSLSRTATPSSCSITRPESRRAPWPASITSTAAAWRRCRASTACTAAGEAHRRQRGRRRHGRLPQLRRRPLRRPRWRRSPPGSTTACRACAGWPPTLGELGIDPARIVVAGESGGGNLTLATGLDAQARRRPRADQGSLRALPVHRRAVAGARVPLVHRERGHPLAPPQQPRRDGLRDRGLQRAQPARVAVLRRGRRRDAASLRRSSASTSATRCATRASTSTACSSPPASPARCRQMMGTMHGTEIFAIACPDISRDTARDIAAFARETPRSPDCTPVGRATLARRATPLAHSPCPARPHSAAWRGGVAAVAGLVASRTAAARAPKPPAVVVRAALAPGKINHILVIEFENEGYARHVRARLPRHLPERHAAPEGRAAAELLRHRARQPRQLHRAGLRPGADGGHPGRLRRQRLRLRQRDAGHARPRPGRRIRARSTAKGCVYPASVKTIASQLDAKYPPNKTTHVAVVARLRAGHGQHAVT